HDYGILGILIYCAILMQLSVKAWKLRNRGPFLQGISRVFLLSLTGMLIFSFTGEPMRYPSAVWYLFSFGSVICYCEARSNYSSIASSEIIAPS
ncbi:MAG TPA: hypothetical protein VGG46_17345, partial [Terriglobales bacterium]